ncbi:hypothetical protein BOQ62_16110 [Chryseobacterium sp. CH21]|uniref:hypothetical protein n=1 Tax=Chryseobacterium sp. CH21 TaxID=713556 RepID=UPI00100B1930|nr:hypothetical protein [Chryseobacterium sp. CH21]RXM38595.1 hypothetical protein BOQ62_16110 [Chryseobacterium sp. CH21]
MKKLLFTGLLGLGLLLPHNFSASNSVNISAKEFSGKKPRKSKTSKKSRSKSSSSSRTFTSSKGCSYNGNQLYVGSRGGCYYYSGSSKQYVDRSYCAGCN